jgi:uncharacterized protein involved in type VI secretion and phage assembly
MSILDIMSGGQLTEDTGRIHGVVIGIVTNNQDPDKLGRVKVKFPWLSDQDESDWARVAAPMAGKGRGAFFLPEVDDEVLVAFEHGDARVPYVIGALWNGKDAPPRDNGDGKNDQRVIHSRAGHELVFDDNDQKGQVMVKTKGGHQVLLDDTAQGPKVMVKSSAGHQIVLDDSPGQENITIQDKTGSNKIVFDSLQNAISIAAQMKISLKALQIEIESDTTMTIKAGAVLTIKGTLVQIN